MQEFPWFCLFRNLHSSIVWFRFKRKHMHNSDDMSGEISLYFSFSATKYWTKKKTHHKMSLFLATQICIAHGRGSACLSCFFFFILTVCILCTCFVHLFIAQISFRSLSINEWIITGKEYSPNFRIVVGQPKCRSRIGQLKDNNPISRKSIIRSNIMPYRCWKNVLLCWCLMNVLLWMGSKICQCWRFAIA